MADIKTVSKWLMVPAFMLSVGLLAGACGGDDDDDGSTPTTPTPTVAPTPTPTPTATPVPPFWGVVEFSDLEDGAPLLLSLENLQGERDMTATITYEVRDFTVAEEGNCGNDPDCGRVLVQLDGEDNVESTRPGSATVDFNDFDDPTGTHTLTLVLIYDDGSSTGSSAEVSVDVQTPPPTVTILQPVTNDNMDLPDDGLLDIVLSAGNFIVDNDCGDVVNCGSFYLYFTDNDGNSLGDYSVTEAPAADETGFYTITVDLNQLEPPTGERVLHVQLHDNDGNAYTSIQDDPVEAIRVFNVRSPDDPSIVITDPATDDVVPLGADGYKSVTITFSTPNFNVSDDCNGVEKCGYIRVYVDGVVGNADGLTYNNVSTVANTADARFFWLDFNGFAAVGTHTVRLALFDETDTQVTAGDRAVEASIDFETTVDQDNTNPLIIIALPTNGQTMPLNEGALSVSFSNDSDNFTLKEPGACGDAEACGHVMAYVDDDGAEGTNAGIASETPISVDFSGLEIGTDPGQLYDPDGHRIMLLLTDDDHNPVTVASKDGSEDIFVADWVRVVIRQTQTPPGGGQ